MDPATSTLSASTTNVNRGLNPGFKLSARQEQLLMAALNSTDRKTSPNNNSSPHANPNQFANSHTMAPTALDTSPLQQQAPGSATLGFEESPFIDYDYDFDPDNSFDFGFANDSQGQMIGSLPGATPLEGDADLHDKRSHPDDLDDDDEHDGKRREGEEKQSKKPGRKPLTSEPTTKRKAQNRAAQRAFRERKEKHLKDLETKVEDLEKASESANHENSLLRAQIEKMSAELQEYRKRFSLNGGLNRSASLNSQGVPPYLAGKGLAGISNPNDVNFSFEFPKFGRLPGPPQPSHTAMSSPSDLSSPGFGLQQNPSPRNQSVNSITSNGLTQTPAPINGTDMSSLSGLFSPSLLDTVSKSPNYDFFGSTGARTNGSRSSTDSNGHNTSYSSPSASSNGQHGSSSSCGTSPEPSTQSPHMGKPVDSTLTTIGEEKTDEGNLLNQNLEFNGIDWFAEQNNNQFDPQLFGDYREPQENILSGDAVNNDSFFSDAFAFPEFQTPVSLEPSPAPAKKDLLAQIDRKQDEDEVVPAEDRSKLLNCNTIWDRLQACPSVKEGEFDLDLLCKDLQKKAKCSETGAVVNESDFNKVLHNYVNKSNTTAKKV